MADKLILTIGALLVFASLCAATTTVALVSPSNGAGVPSSTKLLNLAWTASDGETGTIGLGCVLYIKRPGTQNFLPLGKKGVANGGVAWITAPLPRTGTYSWYVKCSNGRSIGVSPTWSFVKAS